MLPKIIQNLDGYYPADGGSLQWAEEAGANPFFLPGRKSNFTLIMWLRQAPSGYY